VVVLRRYFRLFEIHLPDAKASLPAHLLVRLIESPHDKDHQHDPRNVKAEPADKVRKEQAADDVHQRILRIDQTTCGGIARQQPTQVRMKNSSQNKQTNKRQIREAKTQS
jgi:hypothetical protein